MSEEEAITAAAAELALEEQKETDYQPPAVKSIDDILKTDEEDESLKKYKAALLGSAVAGSGAIVVDESDPRKVIVKKLGLVVEGREEKIIDLTQDLETIKSSSFTIKEGCKFRIRIEFVVQREIVHGLKYVQKTKKKGIAIDKMNYMVGAYAPKEEPYSYLTQVEDAPSGLLGRGSYTVASLFTDDDKNEHLKWEWSLEIKKDW